ncbi:hypothetical protein [Enterovibrio coralii]|uniref:PilZ domain-containing protein n=1 Tax=Enterovibrio coralii TaxID=294935 RepID=A0A135I9I6_9GAMM|nr:hypothetical protein [Enterovibrio coralii]KXF82115.1 hypothetical protein ATN88_20110 [Enterovibrio coralii]
MEKDEEENQQNREFFRLRYNENERPIFLAEGDKFPVCEISEQGVRLLVKEDTQVVDGRIIAGIIQFEDGSEVEIQGKPFRREENELIVRLHHGLELKKINEEQIRIRKKYSRD